MMMVMMMRVNIHTFKWLMHVRNCCDSCCWEIDVVDFIIAIFMMLIMMVVMMFSCRY